MRKIDVATVKNIYSVFNNNAPVEYYVKDENESVHDFCLQIFEELKTENTKSFYIYPYGNIEADYVFEYDKDEDEEDMWVIPKDDLFEK